MAWKSGEVEVDLLHRDHLCVATAGGTTLHAEGRAERGLADAHHRPAADAVEPVDETDRGGRLALPGRCGIDGRDEDQPAIRPLAQRADEAGPDLRLVVPVGRQLLRRDSKYRPHLQDRLLPRHPRDFDVRLHCQSRSPWHLAAELATEPAAWQAPLVVVCKSEFYFLVYLPLIVTYGCS